MADTSTAFQNAYRQEFVQGFEQHKSLLQTRVCTQFEVQKGNQAYFIVADSGPNAVAVTRGTNGLIPARSDDLTQTAATLTEWHDLVRKTRFNIFASQGDQRAIMQMTSQGVLNRKIDTDILTTLDANVNQHTGAAATASVGMVLRAKAILGNNAVPLGKNITAVISPAFDSYLAMTKEYTDRQYIGDVGGYFKDGKPYYDDQPFAYFWMGVLWIVHPNITGAATSSEKCYMFVREAVGRATDVAGLQSLVGYHEEQDYSWARTTCYFGTALIQTKGVVQMTHDGSGLVYT